MSVRSDDLAQKIIHGTEDPRLKWKSDSLVQVRIGKVISATTGLAKQTLIGRRKRFRAALEAQLHQSGWEVAGQNTYAKGDGR